MNKEDLLQLKIGEEEPQVFTRWIDPTIEQLQQENKQLKSILTELEEWLKVQGNNGIDEWGNHYTVCLYSLNMLKEKYNLGDKENE